MRVVKKPEERKAEMVAAAAKLFAQQGFVRTSVSEIVSAVDVAKGLFYYYFTTKADMVIWARWPSRLPTARARRARNSPG